LKRNGFRVKTKALRRFEDGSTKANLDMELAIDLLTQAPHIDVAIVVSGDGDFVNLVDAAQNAGLRIEVAATPRQAATDLMDIADQFIDLEANVAQYARADLPPRQAYTRPEGVVPAARTPPTGGFAPRPYGSSVRGYQSAGNSFSPHTDDDERPGNRDDSGTADDEEREALPLPPAGK
jgi:hypothetical protein